VEQLGDISQILFFLIGAMTNVELIDSYNGFKAISDNKNIEIWILRSNSLIGHLASGFPLPANSEFIILNP